MTMRMHRLMVRLFASTTPTALRFMATPPIPTVMLTSMLAPASTRSTCRLTATSRNPPFIHYSPVADAADGDVDESGLDADVIVALDPLPGVLNVVLTLDGQPTTGYVGVYPATVGDATGFRSAANLVRSVLCWNGSLTPGPGSGQVADDGAVDATGEFSVTLPCG